MSGCSGWRLPMGRSTVTLTRRPRQWVRSGLVEQPEAEASTLSNEVPHNGATFVSAQHFDKARLLKDRQQPRICRRIRDAFLAWIYGVALYNGPATFRDVRERSFEEH